MKRIAISALTVVALATLSSCGEGEPDPAPTRSSSPGETPTEEPAEEEENPTETPSEDSVEEPAEEVVPEVPEEEPLDPTRFRTTATELNKLTEKANASKEPKNAEEANKALGLSEKTPLMFVDYSVTEKGGSFCVEANKLNTYVAVAFADEDFVLNLGDGPCSYDTAAAEVVGDLTNNTWSTGEDLMGKIKPFSLLD